MRIQFQWPWRRRDAIGAEIDEELRFHLEMRVAELKGSGLSAEAAERQALAEFGDLDSARRSLRRTDQGTEERRRRRIRLDELWRDAGFAARQLRRAPGFTLLAVLTLALGVGLTTAVFSVVNGVLLAPLPYPDAGRLVTLWQLDTRKGEREKPSPANFFDWRERSRSFTHLAAAVPYGYDLLGEGDPVGLNALQLSEGYLEALGIVPLAGRRFAAEEYETGGPASVLLSERLWRGRYGGDPAVVGRVLRFSEGPYEVVGVVPDRLEYPYRVDVYTPRPFNEQLRQQRAATYYDVIGRLGPGVSLEQARQEMARIARDLEREYPRPNARVTVPVVSLHEAVTGRAQRALLVLLGAVSLVLLIACVNVANLLLARGLGRRGELAVRAALGAGRGRIARQLLVESGMLAVLGGALGILLAALALPMVVRGAVVAGLPRTEVIGLDLGVLAGGLLATFVTVLVAGGLPAWRLSSGAEGLAVRGARAVDEVGKARRTGRLLVSAEVAVALMLLIGAGLLARSLGRLVSEELGYGTTNRLMFTTHFWDRYPEAARRAAFMEQVMRRLEVLPGVLGAGAGSALPLSVEGSDMDPPFSVDGRPAPGPGEEPTARVTIVTPGYFKAMGIKLIKGRLFTPADGAESSPVVVVSETMARRIWPNEEPLGKRITSSARAAPQSREVIGVVADTRYAGHAEAPRLAYYIPHPQWAFGSMTIVLHTRGDPHAVLPLAQRAVWDESPNLTFAAVESLEGLLAGTLVMRRVILFMIVAFAGLGAVLAAMGIYGVVSLSVAQRTRELGVRMALGAEAGSLKGLVLRQGLRMTLVGIAGGVIGALALTRLLGSLLYGTRPTDAPSFVGAGVLLGVVALVAAWVPARRATRVDPLEALRAD